MVNNSLRNYVSGVENYFDCLFGVEHCLSDTHLQRSQTRRFASSQIGVALVFQFLSGCVSQHNCFLYITYALENGMSVCECDVSMCMVSN